MIQNVNCNSVQDIMPKPAQRSNQGPTTSTQAPVDATLQTEYAPLVAEALRSSETDAEAVQRAQALLASGQLDSIEAIREAAQNIVDLGI